MPSLTPEAERYVSEVVARLAAVLGDELVGAYLIGSAALDDWVPAGSDIDVMVVCEQALPAPRRRSVAAPLWHDRLPCPARGLELVAYRREQVGRPQDPLEFELDLNTGPGMDDRLSIDAADEPGHWFLLDLAGARQGARPLVGPPPADLVGEVPRPVVIEALRRSLDWHRDHEDAGANAVLNACRAWAYAETGAWCSKSRAAAWAGRRTSAPVIGRAVAARAAGGGPRLDRQLVLPFLEHVRERLPG